MNKHFIRLVEYFDTIDLIEIQFTQLNKNPDFKIFC